MKIPVLVEIIVRSEKTNTKEFLSKKGMVYSFLNPVSYLEVKPHESLFSQYNGVFADGSILVLAIRILYGKKVIRRSFDMSSLGAELFQYASDNGKSVFIVSSEQENVENAIDRIKERFPQLMISGYRNGFFSDLEEQDNAIDEIIHQNPDFLIVGMGAVKQEEFLLRAKQNGFNGIGFTCGGFITQIAENRIDYYPSWVNKMNLRFLYRIYKEPHTRKRYLRAGIIFPIIMLKERLGI